MKEAGSAPHESSGLLRIASSHAGISGANINMEFICMAKVVGKESPGNSLCPREVHVQGTIKI